MVAHNALTRVLWPSDAPRTSLPGVLVGFRNSETDVFVVAVLEEVEVSIKWEQSHSWLY
jgi:phosphatidylinositol glycan class Q protein